MILRFGRRYRRRDGEVTPPLRRTFNTRLYGWTDGQHFYWGNGRRNMWPMEDSPHDLVEEVNQ